MDRKSKVAYKNMMKDTLPLLKHFCSLRNDVDSMCFSDGKFVADNKTVSSLIDFSEDAINKVETFMKDFSVAYKSFNGTLNNRSVEKVKELKKMFSESKENLKVLKFRTKEVGCMSKNFSLSTDGVVTANFSEGDGVFKGVAYALAEALKKAADFIENSATMIADIARGEAGAESETQESALNDNLDEVAPTVEGEQASPEEVPVDEVEIETPTTPVDEIEPTAVDEVGVEQEEALPFGTEGEQPEMPAEEELPPPMVNGQPVQFALHLGDILKEYKNFAGTSKVNEKEVKVLKNSLEYGKCLLCSKKRPSSKEIAEYVDFASRSLGGKAREFLLTKIKEFATAKNKEKVTMEKQKKVMFSRLLNKGRMMLLSKKVTKGAFDKYMEEVEVCLPEAQDKQELYVRLEAFQKANAKAEKMSDWAKEEETLISKKAPKLKTDIAPSKIKEPTGHRLFAKRTAEKIYDAASSMIEKGYNPAKVVAHFAKKHGMNKPTVRAFAEALSEEFGINHEDFGVLGGVAGGALGSGAGYAAGGAIADLAGKAASKFGGAGSAIGKGLQAVANNKELVKGIGTGLGAVGGMAVGNAVGNAIVSDKEFANEDEKVGKRGGEIKTVNTCDFAQVVQRCKKLVKDFGLGAKTTKRILTKKFPHIAEADIDAILDIVCEGDCCNKQFAKEEEEEGTAAAVLEKAKEGKWMSPEEAREAIVEDVVMMKEAQQAANFADKDAPVEEEVVEGPEAEAPVVEEEVVEEPVVEPAPVMDVEEGPAFDTVATAELDIPVEVTIKDNEIDSRLDIAETALDGVDQEMAMFARSMISKAKARKCFSEEDLSDKSAIADSIETIIEGLTKIKDTVAGEAPVSADDTEVVAVDEIPENEDMPVVDELPTETTDIEIYTPSDDVFVEEEETQVANFSADRSSWTYGEIIWGRN